MPNYCTNIVRAPKEVLEELYDDGRVTFQKLIPMPKELEITEGTVTENAIAFVINKKESEDFLKVKNLLKGIKDDYYGDLWNKYMKNITVNKMKEIERAANRYIPDETEKKLGIKTLEEFGKLCLNNISKYGCATWYDWSCKNWGTKWDAMKTEGTPEEGEVSFLTAWAEPINVIEKLFKKYPNCKIEWEYIGEFNEFRGKIYSNGDGIIHKEEYEIENEEEEDEE